MSTVEALSDMFKFKSDKLHPDINTTEIYAQICESDRIRSL